MEKIVNLEKNEKFQKIINNNPIENSVKIFDRIVVNGSGYMSVDFITRPEFKEHQKHMDARFDGIENKIELNNQIISKNINEAVSNLKEEISDKKLTTNRFWIGISIPAIISIVGILISIFI